jgi:hypothetical protein
LIVTVGASVVVTGTIVVRDDEFDVEVVVDVA